MLIVLIFEVCVKTVIFQCFVLKYMVVQGRLFFWAFAGTCGHNLTLSCDDHSLQPSLDCSRLTESFLHVSLAAFLTSVDSKELQLET